MLNSGLRFTAIMLAAMVMAACSDSDRPDFYNGTGLMYVDIVPESPVFANVETPSAADFRLAITSAQGETHSWATFGEFEQGSRYLAGDYTVTATYGDIADEGFDKPCYEATQTIHLTEGERTTAALAPVMASTMVTVSRSEAFNEHFSTIYIHSFNGSYIDFATDENRIAYLRPGEVFIAADMPGDTAPLTLFISGDVECKAASLSAFEFDYDTENGTVTVSRRVDNASPTPVAEFVLTPEMLEGSGPMVSASATALSLPELTPPSDAVTFSVDCPAPVSGVILTVNSSSSALTDIAGEINLTDLTELQRRFFEQCGMKLPEFAGEFTIDISPLIAVLTNPASAGGVTTTFTLEVIDHLMRINRPVSISVNTLPVSLRVLKASPVCIGVNVTDLLIEAPDADPSRHLSVRTPGPDGVEQPLAIESLTPGEQTGTWIARVAVPDGNDPLRLLLYYDNALKDSITVQRVAPAFSLKVDAFAKSIAVKVTAQDESLGAILTERLRLFIDGNAVSTFSRIPKSGIITVVGLSPATSYTLTTGIADRPTSEPVYFTTEPVRELPNGDFEDIKHTINLKDVLSGGLYSQTFAEIFNKQNKASFDYHTPTVWANTNAKTFNKAAKNLNTWYIQPSVVTSNDAMSGDLAAELRSVAYDPAGEAIPPYLQEARPFVNYSRNIPNISYRAAGRLFLGTYVFNPATLAETITEGIPFGSRPQALNGYYHYLPSRSKPDDVGAVSIELRDASGNVIGSGSARLPLATSYTSFNVPVTYKFFGAKAASLRVMITSSDVPAGITSETSSVITYPDPVTASSIGSILTIDNLTLAY